MEIHIGPIHPAMQNYSAVTNQTVYNPRCLRRDLSDWIPNNFFNKANLLNLTTGEAAASVFTFQNELQGRLGFLGLHAGGHYAMGGDASDVFSSVNDPAFWLHHTMLDSIWWIWQALNPDKADEVAGLTDTRPNNSTVNGTADFIQDLGALAGPIKLKTVLDTLGDTPLCYYYA
jgi:tyrosinase